MPFPPPINNNAALQASGVSQFPDRLSMADETNDIAICEAIQLDENKASLFQVAARWLGPLGDSDAPLALDNVKISQPSPLTSYWEGAIDGSISNATLKTMTHVLKGFFLETQNSDCTQMMLVSDRAQLLLKQNENHKVDMYRDADIAEMTPGCSATLERYSDVNQFLTISIIQALYGEAAARRFFRPEEVPNAMPTERDVFGYLSDLKEKSDIKAREGTMFFGLRGRAAENMEPVSRSDSPFDTAGSERSSIDQAASENTPETSGPPVLVLPAQPEQFFVKPYGAAANDQDSGPRSGTESGRFEGVPADPPPQENTQLTAALQPETYLPHGGLINAAKHVEAAKERDDREKEFVTIDLTLRADHGDVLVTCSDHEKHVQSEVVKRKEAADGIEQRPERDPADRGT